jgi:protein-tyrosine phosphatase
MRFGLLQLSSRENASEEAVKAFDWIVQNVAQGSYPSLKGAAFQHADVLVLCAEEHQVPSLKAPAGKHIVRLGFDDDSYRPISAKDAERFHMHAKQLGAAALAGRKLMITCHMGLNRSGLITALTLMHGFRMSPSDAIKLIRARRSSDCLCNPMFERWLLNHDPRRRG